MGMQIYIKIPLIVENLWFSVETPCQIQGIYEYIVIIIQCSLFTLFYSSFIHLSIVIFHFILFSDIFFALYKIKGSQN